MATGEAAIASAEGTRAYIDEFVPEDESLVGGPP